ncbi:hypothetical protein [Alkanindiges hydrocarboniclasticus]|nr:hypothetical protein [Alkanindiges hydrocarboniclasticus]
MNHGQFVLLNDSWRSVVSQYAGLPHQVNQRPPNNNSGKFLM